MGLFQLRSFSVEESSRLATLIAKAKDGVITPGEDRTLVELISRAEAISRHNARQLRALSGKDESPPPAATSLTAKKRRRSDAKLS